MGRRLGLIAGSGRLPFEVARAAREAGVEVAVLGIENNTDPAIAGLASAGHTFIAAGEISRLIAFFKGAEADEVILAGAVAKREMFQDPAALRPDARALALLASLPDRGDDTLLRAVAAELESEGLPVVDSTKYLAGRLTRVGPLAGPLPTPEIVADLALGMRVAKALGLHDVGQTVVVKAGTVLAVEALEGTDATVRRAVELGGPGATLVKASKPDQDLRFDVPAIGPATLELARECRLAAIGLEAGRTIVLELEQASALAEAARVAVVGLAGDPQ